MEKQKKMKSCGKQMELMYAFAYSIVENVTVYFERFDGVAIRRMHTAAHTHTHRHFEKKRKHIKNKNGRQCFDANKSQGANGLLFMQVAFTFCRVNVK